MYWRFTDREPVLRRFGPPKQRISMKHLGVGLVVSLLSLASLLVPETQTIAADRQVIRIDNGWKFQREGPRSDSGSR